jgi:nucleoside-diphosphate-sugar epimerase
VLGDGTNRYQFVHAEDLADACILAGNREGPGVFNIGTDRFGTMFETLDRLCSHAGTGAEVRRVPAGLAAVGMEMTARLGLTPFAPYHWLMYSKSMWFDITDAREQLGWSPKWSTDDMFAQSYDWFVTHRSETTDANASHHRRSARQGLLSGLKHITKILPRVTEIPHE